MRTIVALSKKQKPKNHRSQFLSAMMKGLGGDAGNAVAEAYVGKDIDKFKEEMTKIVNKVASKMPNLKAEK
jgi:hypothetical protein